MSPATRIWIEAMLRLIRGMCTETEKWLKAQAEQKPS